MWRGPFSIISMSVSMIMFTGAYYQFPSLADPTFGDRIDRKKNTLSQKQLWAVACPALLDEMNRDNHDQLATQELTPRNREAKKLSLQQWWNVNNRDDLLKSLKWIEEGGHRQYFAKLGQALNENNTDKLYKLQTMLRQDDAEFVQTSDVCSKNYKKFGAKSLIGWDYCRYIDLCRWGYLAGYLTEDEAWNRIMPAAKLLQKTFGSWADLGTNYMVGRQYWSAGIAARDKNKIQTTYITLLSDPESSWFKLPWRLPLE
jgi:hypothetical protein